jgi:hypothetical protein
MGSDIIDEVSDEQIDLFETFVDMWASIYGSSQECPEIDIPECPES